MQIKNSNRLDNNLTPDESLWVYNGMDCAATLLIWKNMQKVRTENSDISFNFVSAMRAPALEMSLRGIRIDMNKRMEMINTYTQRLTKLQEILDQFCIAVCGQTINYASPTQLKKLFYGTMQLPEQYKIVKGVRTVSSDRTALEKLTVYFHAKPLVNTILAMRDAAKFLQFLKTDIDEDSRFRPSFNVVGTETGRWSSSTNAFNTGSNVQNITDDGRIILIADEGFKLGYTDLEQAESRAVAYISGDLNYIKAFESGDLHTTVCKMCFTDLPWTGDMKKDKALASQPYYRHFSYRDIAKRLGHGTNYNGQARTLAGILKIPEEVVVKFQHAYFSAFPKIREWHHTVARQIQTEGFLITAMKRKRQFLGRRFDNSTLREAIAFDPQSTVAEYLNLYLYRIWKSKLVQPLAQIHDAVLFQYKAKDEDYILPKILELASIEVPFACGTMVIPSEMQIGWNWAKASADNKHGMIKYNGKDNRDAPTYGNLLDWKVC